MSKYLMGSIVNSPRWILYCKISVSMIFVLTGFFSASAQEPVIFFQLQPPFDQPLENYKDQLVINITNPGSEDVSGFLEINIFNSDKSILIGSTPAGRKSITLESGVTSYTGTDLDDLLAINRLNFTGVNADEVFFDLGLPAGRYYLCLEFYNAQNVPISNTACTNFQVNVPAVAGVLSLLPPYNVPFNEYSDQTTLTLTSSSAFTGVMEITVSDFNSSIVVKKKSNVTLESGANILSGTDLEYYFSPAGFTTLSGITENQLFDTGLPPGNYLMTFTLTLDDAQVAVVNNQFAVPVSSIIMNARATPPFDVSMEDLLAQTTITIQSTNNLTGAYLTMTVTGEDVVIETDRDAAVRTIDVQANMPEIIEAGDLINISGIGVRFEGSIDVDNISHGLPSGNFSYCFRLYDNAGQLLTESPSCFSLNVPPTFLTVAVQATPPFVTKAEDIYNMLRVTVNPSRKMGIGFNARIVGDNGVEITTTGSRSPEPVSLEKNEPAMLDGTDLYTFFDADQFLATGISRDKLRDSDLPEGNYQVCLTPYVIEGYPLDNAVEICSNSFPINYVEPPQLLTPQCGQVIDITRGQFITFNWLPSPGVAPDTEYTLKIVEMRIRGQNPMDAILTSTSPTFFEEKIMGTSYLYGPGDPLLEPGYEYAYVVYLGDEPVRGNYTNKGFSQACTFTVLDNAIVDDPTVEDTTQTVTPRQFAVTTPIEESPFPGFNFPTTKVVGSLRYKFKGASSVSFMTQGGNNAAISANNNNSSQSGFTQQGNVQTGVHNAANMMHSYQPSFNENDMSAAGSFPLSGVSVKLIEGYLMYGTAQGEEKSGDFITQLYGVTVKTIASAITDTEGNFEFTFIQSDSLGKPNTISAIESQISMNNLTGTYFKVYRLIVESPYYCSPEMNIVVQPWQQLDVGTLVSYVKSYELKVISKTSATGDYFADQGGGVGVTIPLAKTQLRRTTAIPTIPSNEGQNLEDNLVAEGTTDANGAVIFKNLVRHSFNNPLDKYTIKCETNKNTGEYNFETTSQSYPLLSHPSLGPYSYSLPVDFNSQWVVYQYIDTVKMFPDFPRVFGEVNGAQPPAELAQQRNSASSAPSVSNGLSVSSSNSSIQNLISTPLYQSNMTISEFSGIYQQTPNWSEQVNKAALPDVTVNLWETYQHWQTNNTQPVVKLQKQSDANGQFSFDNLQMEITEEFAVDGPARLLIIEHPGYKKYIKNIPQEGSLKWGQQYEVNDILLEPDGFVFGFVQDEKGNPVKAEVFVGEFTSAVTVQSQEVQNILGISGGLKELFIIKAPSGGNVKLHIVPDDPIYVPSNYLVIINENNTKIPQNLGGFNVGLYKHRIMLEVVEEEQFTGNAIQGGTKWNPPVKNALVKVTNLLSQGPATNTKTSQPSSGGLTTAQQANNAIVNPDIVIYGYTDQNGFVTLTFTNNSQEFEIEVIPPADLGLEKKTTTITSVPSGQSVYAGKIVLKKAWSLSGTVTYGSNATPLANARVYIDDNLEVFTNSAGKYTLHYIPEKFRNYSITAENQDNPLTLIAETKNIQFPFSGNLDFNLTEFNDFEIKELMGIPVTVKSITPSGSNYVLDGAFIDLPANENFSPKDDTDQLKFHQVPITSEQKNGKLVAKAVNNSIALDESELNLINYTKFIAKQTPLSGNQLVITSNSSGQGSITGIVTLMNSSFQFDQHYMSFNEETSPPSSGGGFVQVQQANVITDKLQRSYIELFNDQSQFRLFNKQQNTAVVKTLTAAAYPLQPFGVSDQSNQDYEFKIQDFKAVARKANSYVYRDTLVLATTLIADNIPLAIPKTLEVDAGNIIVSAYGFEKIIGGEPLTFKLEKWQVTCDNWTLNPNVTGIIAPTGKINFGLFTTEIKDIKILPNDLQLGALNLNKFKLGDIVPITLKANTVSFDIDNAAGTDNAPHWSMSIIGFNNQPAASIKGLPGMLSTDEILMQEVVLLSNGDQKMIIGNQDKWLTFYNIIKVKPDQFTMLDGGLQLSASLDLEIPLLDESNGSFRYTKSNGILQSQFLGMDVGFTMPGNTMFVGDQNIGSQILQQNKFEAIGYVKHEEKVKLFTRMVKTLDSTYIYVDPLHQTLAIADDGSNYMAEVTGGTRAIQNDWNKFVFSGDLTGMKGVEDSKKRKTFTINGSINAENEGLDVKNISAGFGGMKITYDFEHDRLTGSLDFQQDFSSVKITGHADFLTDKDGWLFIAGGSVTTPGFGQLKAGLGIGDYGNMSVLIEGNSIESRLLQEAHNKNLPNAFQNGFSGFFFTGMKDIPQLSIPETGFDFLFISGSLELTTGFDARLWMGFDGSDAEFGIGVMAFAELTLMVDASLSCSSLYGYLGLELGVEGMYNTGTGTFSLAGCASIAIAGAAEQCSIPVCNPPCLSGCDDLALKATMSFDSDGNVDAGFSLGSCGGGNPLSQEIKDKFGCN